MSSCSHTAEPFVTTSRSSTKIFQMPFGHTINMTAEAQLHTREPARTVDIAPGLNITCSSALAKLRGWITLPCSPWTKYKFLMVKKQQLQAQWSPSLEGGRTNKQYVGRYQSYPDPAMRKPPDQTLTPTKITPKWLTMYTNSQAQNRLYGTTMLQQGSQLKPHRWKQ